MSQDKSNGKITRAEYEIMLDQIAEILPSQLRIYPMHAKALRAKFDALLVEGFTESQALEIVKTRPIFE